MKQWIAAAFMLTLFGNGTITAQDFYTVWVGTFVEVRPQDFTAARQQGFTYAVDDNTGSSQIYVGRYTQSATAEGVAKALQQKGFAAAQVIQGKYPAGASAVVIQIATRFANRPIDWEQLSQVGKLNVLVQDNSLKILTGVFPDMATAKNELPRIQALGFKDAFVKSVPMGEILPVTNIATGLKEDLIPLNLSDNPVTSPPTTTVPVQMEQPGRPVITPSAPAVPPPASAPVATPTNQPKGTTVVPVVPTPSVTALPDIRGNIKRNAALELQKVLKAADYYTGSLDGYYGEGTTLAYQQMMRQYPTVRKYIHLLSFYEDQSVGKQGDALQQAIQQLPYDPNAPLVIEKAGISVGKGYQAYQMLVTLGPGQQVNDLMNAALREAFEGTGIPTSTYREYLCLSRYQPIEIPPLVITRHPHQHLPTPCWLSDRHPPEAVRQGIAQMGTMASSLRQATCTPWAVARGAVAFIRRFRCSTTHYCFPHTRAYSGLLVL
ncbi:MAG: peptidoglycan-binding domain-containing protein [Saprospiraceae bacterium]